jgi:hypothetical protein
VQADVSPPALLPGSAVYNTQYFRNRQAQGSVTSLSVSWDRFVDPETEVQSYFYQVFRYHRSSKGKKVDEDHEANALTAKQVVEEEDAQRHSMFLVDLNLAFGESYIVRIYAVNGAGLEGFA